MDYGFDPDYDSHDQYFVYYDNFNNENGLNNLSQMTENPWLAATRTTEDDGATVDPELGYEFPNDDAAWVMACCFMIFTMQTGFGLYESGICSKKNMTSTMIVNVLDVSLGGMVFWAFGYAIIFGDHPYSTPFYGVGKYFFSPDVNELGAGEHYLKFALMTAYVSAATTIPSGAMLERNNFWGFAVYSVINVVIFCFPANWVWGPKGWLKHLGVVDLAGAGPVYLFGGVSGFVSAAYLGPRTGRKKQQGRIVMGNAKMSMTGLFMLWWGFLAYNSAATFGVTGSQWMYTAKATVTTMTASFGGGLAGLSANYLLFRGKIYVPYVCNSVLGSLVSITCCSFLVPTWAALVIGCLSGVITILSMMVLERSIIDDPCAASVTHGLSGLWGIIATGIFAKPVPDMHHFNYGGLIYGGGWYLMSVQALEAVVIIAWTVGMTLPALWCINKAVGMRASLLEEILGSDYCVHNILHEGIGLEEAVEILSQHHDDVKTGLDPAGVNLGHVIYLDMHFNNRGTGIREAWSAKEPKEEIVHGEEVKALSKRIRDSRRPRRSEGGGAFGGRVKRSTT